MLLGLTPTGWLILACELAAGAGLVALLGFLSPPSKPESEDDWLDRQY